MITIQILHGLIPEKTLFQRIYDNRPALIIELEKFVEKEWSNNKAALTLNQLVELLGLIQKNYPKGNYAGDQNYQVIQTVINGIIQALKNGGYPISNFKLLINSRLYESLKILQAANMLTDNVFKWAMSLSINQVDALRVALEIFNFKILLSLEYMMLYLASDSLSTLRKAYSYDSNNNRIQWIVNTTSLFGDDQISDDTVKDICNELLAQLMGADQAKKIQDNASTFINRYVKNGRAITHKFNRPGERDAEDILYLMYDLMHAGILTPKILGFIFSYTPKYELALMSSLPEDNPEHAVEGKVYLADDGKYIVRHPEGIVKTGTFDKNFIGAGSVADKLQNEQFKEVILEIISKKGHIPNSTNLNSMIEMLNKIRNFHKGYVGKNVKISEEIFCSIVNYLQISMGFDYLFIYNQKFTIKGLYTVFEFFNKHIAQHHLLNEIMFETLLILESAGLLTDGNKNVVLQKILPPNDLCQTVYLVENLVDYTKKEPAIVVTKNPPAVYQFDSEEKCIELASGNNNLERILKDTISLYASGIRTSDVDPIVNLTLGYKNANGFLDVDAELILSRIESDFQENYHTALKNSKYKAREFQISFLEKNI